MAFSFNGIPLPIGGNPLGTKRSKFGIGTAIFLVFLGGVFLVSSYIIYTMIEIDGSWKRVDGTIVGVSEHIDSDKGTMYTPRVEYTVAGQTYTVLSDMSSSSRPSVGSTQSVGYNPSDPSESRVDEGAGGITFIGAFAGAGLLAILLGPILYIRSRRRTASINKLIQSGQKVTGVVTGINSNRNGTNQNSQTFIAEVSATDLSGTVRQFTSDSLTGLGPLAMMDFQSNPIPVDVYIDPTKPDNYYVDISDLPNLTPARIAELIAQKLPGKISE